MLSVLLHRLIDIGADDNAAHRFIGLSSAVLSSDGRSQYITVYTLHDLDALDSCVMLKCSLVVW